MSRPEQDHDTEDHDTEDHDTEDHDTEDHDTEDHDDPQGVRLQKVLAAAGVASRRASEIMISEGRVEVNGRLVTEQGLRVHPDSDVIRVDGSRLPPPRRHAYVVLNKPRGVVSTMEDPEGRPTLTDYVDDRPERLFHVGRLDTDTEGLIILTNHGEFAYRLAHPAYEVSKTYLAEVAGVMAPHTVRRLLKGVTLEDGRIAADAAKVVDAARRSSGPGDRTLLQLTLHSGRNRVVRRMLESVGHPVNKLSRTAIGPVRLGRLSSGAVRDLTPDELGALLDLVKL